MAMIDYGAILRVDGKIVNLDQMFMDCADTRYICQQAYDEKHKQTIDIQHNYFVYAGDANFLLVFYNLTGTTPKFQLRRCQPAYSETQVSFVYQFSLENTYILLYKMYILKY